MALLPQHETVPLPRSAQTYPLCDAIARAPMSPAMPVAATGDVRRDKELLPSWPEELSPQQCTVPFARSAQAWFVPALIATALSRVCTATDEPGHPWSRCRVGRCSPGPSSARCRRRGSRSQSDPRPRAKSHRRHW